jgi:DNA-3-methyladenine glycosylase
VKLADLLAGPVVDAATGLLGRRLTSTIGGSAASVILTEVEAYAGEDDPASHAFRGPTRRNGVMFGPPGGLYVYRSYGIHWCMNVVCGAEGSARAVLLRGGLPVAGADLMEARRGRSTNLADGPGKLCQALGVGGSLDGSSVFDGPVTISGEAVAGTVVASQRIGISKAMERVWRFVLNPSLESGVGSQEPV